MLSSSDPDKSKLNRYHLFIEKLTSHIISYQSRNLTVFIIVKVPILTEHSHLDPNLTRRKPDKE